MKLYRSIIFLTFVIFSIACAPQVFAHGFGGSMEKESNGLLIDIGYDPENGTALSTFVYDFGLLKPDTKEPIEFTDVWVRISKDKKTYLATGISKARIGKTTLAYIYPEEGTYQMSVRFQNGKDTLSETTFDLIVSPYKSNSFVMPSWGYGLIGLVVGIGVSLGIIINKKKNE
jgi:hypothetical protein